MIAEDETIVAMALKNMLERLQYRVVESVLTGEEAIRKAITLHPDLILMDIKLKGDIDGIDAAKKIRKQFDIPIIFLTAYADEETVKRAKYLEPFAYIIKPFNELSLRSNIEITMYKHKMERKLKETKRHLESIINNISEMLFSVDEKNQIIIWNNTAERITGYKRKEVQKIPLQNLPFFEKTQELIRVLEKARKMQRTPSKINLKIYPKYGSKKTIQISPPAIIKNTNDDSSEIVIVGKDITADAEILNPISKGNSYLWLNKDHEVLLKILSNLSGLKHKCLFISRSLSENQRFQLSSEGIQTILLQDHAVEEHDIISNLDELQTEIQNFCKQNENAAVVIDRIEYLIMKYSFKEVLLQLFQITDYVRETHSLLVLHIDPAILDAQQQAIFENEFIRLPEYPIEKITIGRDDVAILNFLSIEKQRKYVATYKTLKEEMKSTYPTITRKIRELEQKGLVIVYKQGRSKIIEITKMGEHLLKK